jgi:hypothetical protein
LKKLKGNITDTPLLAAVFLDKDPAQISLIIK